MSLTNKAEYPAPIPIGGYIMRTKKGLFQNMWELPPRKTYSLIIQLMMWQ